LRSSPLRVVGMPVRRAMRPLKADTPNARRHENDRPGPSLTFFLSFVVDNRELLAQVGGLLVERAPYSNQPI
jgi:hypothetical protein